MMHIEDMDKHTAAIDTAIARMDKPALTKALNAALCYLHLDAKDFEYDTLRAAIENGEAVEAGW